MRTRLGLLALLAIAGVLVVLAGQLPQVARLEAHASELLVPVESALTTVFAGVGDVFSTFGRAAELKAENERLRAEIEALKTASVRVQELEHQNRELLAQLNYQSAHPEQKLLDARVIAREPNDLVHSLTIDRGERDGLVEGMTVVTPAGLVGRLLEVGPTSAKVLLITDSKSSVSGVVASTRAQGMVYGRRQRHLTMRYIDQLEKIAVGEWVVTSSLGGGYPQGIPIGRVVQVHQRDVEPFQEATLEPGVDFARLETVQVITNFVPVYRE